MKYILKKIVHDTQTRETIIDYVCTACGDDGGKAIIPPFHITETDTSYCLDVHWWGRRSCRNNVLSHCFNNFCLYSDNANTKITIERFHIPIPIQKVETVPTTNPMVKIIVMEVKCLICGSINNHELRSAESGVKIVINYNNLGSRICNNCNCHYSL